MNARVLEAPVEAVDPRLQRLLDCAARLPSPPAIVMALLATLGDEDLPVGAIVGHVERDQALTARILRVSNSSYYGLTGRVATVNDATVVLGVSHVRNVAIAGQMVGGYRLPPELRGRLAPFWRHALLAAFAGAALASRTGADGGIAFTAGLLHDIGKLVLASAYPQEYFQPVPPALEPLALERLRFGADHATLGALIAERWRLPLAIVNALRQHHDAQARDPHARIAAYADRIAHAFEEDPRGARTLQLCADALAQLGSRATAPEMHAELERQAGSAAEILPAV